MNTDDAPATGEGTAPDPWPGESAWVRQAQASIDKRPEDASAGAEETPFVVALLDALASQPVRADGAAAATALDSELAQLAAGQQAGPFKIVRYLGHGGFGIVFRAFDAALDRDVALKIPRPETLAQRGALDWLVREARAAAVLDHPNIVPVYATGKLGRVDYIASGYCDGPTLATWLSSRNRPLGVAEAARIAVALADAAAHAHSRGIIHRDLKPANVLLAPAADPPVAGLPFVPRITDFGLSKRIDGEAGAAPSGGPIGTPRYMAPEQLAGDEKQIGVPADIYALGSILYEMLAGAPPFADRRGEDWRQAVCDERPAPLGATRTDVPSDLDAVCHKCLAKTPADRYATAKDLGDDLRRFLSGHSVAARPVAWPTAVGRWCRRRPLSAALVGALLGALWAGGGGVFWQWRRAEANQATAETNAARAEHNLHQAEEAIVSLGWAIDDSIFWRVQPDNYGAEQREELTRYYATVLSQLGARPDAQPIHAAANCFFARVGALGGQLELAREKFGQSIDGWHAVVRAAPDNLQHRRALAKTLHHWGHVLLTIDGLADGVQRFEGQRLFGRFDVHDELGALVLSDYAEVLFEKAEALRDAGRPDGGEADYAACLEICRRLMAARPIQPEWRFRALQARVRLANAHSPLETSDAAYETKQEALAELREWVREQPTSDPYRVELAEVALDVARTTVARGGGRRFDGVLADVADALEVLLRRTDCPRAVWLANARWLHLKTELLIERGDLASALIWAGRCEFWFDEARCAGTIDGLELAQAHRQVAQLYQQCHAEPEATSAWERADRAYREAPSGTALRPAVHREHADVLERLALLYEKRDDRQRACESYLAAAKVLEFCSGLSPTDESVRAQLDRVRSAALRLGKGD